MRMIPPLSAHELFEGLRQLNQRFGGKALALSFERLPETLESTLVPCDATDVCVREGAFVESALPGRDRRGGRALRSCILRGEALSAP